MASATALIVSATGPSVTAYQLGGEGVEVLFPEPTEVRDPGVDLAQRRSVELVVPACTVGPHPHETVVTEHLEVLGDGRLRDAVLVANRVGDGAGRLFSIDEKLEDAAADRVAKDVEGVHAGVSAAGVRRARSVGCRPCLVGGRPGFDRGPAPVVAAQAHERDEIG